MFAFIKFSPNQKQRENVSPKGNESTYFIGIKNKLLSKKQPQLQIQVHKKHSNTINKNKTKKN